MKIVQATDLPSSWWENLSKKEQQLYVKEHPNSKYAKNYKAQVVVPEKQLPTNLNTPLTEQLEKPVNLKQRMADKKNWEKPPFSDEKEEFERVATDLRIPIKKLRDAYENAEPIWLDDKTWSSLQNTDSYDINNKKQLEKMAKTYGKKSLPLLQKQMTTGIVQTPIVVKYRKGKTTELTLLGGNTRLSMAHMLGITPRVHLIDLTK